MNFRNLMKKTGNPKKKKTLKVHNCFKKVNFGETYTEFDGFHGNVSTGNAINISTFS